MAKYSLVEGEYLIVEGEFVRPWDIIRIIMSGLTSWEKGWLSFSWNTRNLVSEDGGLNISDVSHTHYCHSLILHVVLNSKFIHAWNTYKFIHAF
jgi:hypothetical protein